MKNGFIKKAALFMAAAAFCAGVAGTSPAATMTAQAAAGGTGISTQAYFIDYCYKIEDEALYKRLYNFSTRQFIGDWIFIRYLTEDDYEAFGWN